MKLIQEQHSQIDIISANVIQTVAANQKGFRWNKAWIYPASGIADTGLLAVNVGDVYVGKRGAGKDCTPDLLTTGDGPIKYELPVGQVMRLEDIIVQGANVGDGVFISFT